MSAEPNTADSLSMQIRAKARGLVDAPFFNVVADEVVRLQERLLRVEHLAMRQANEIRRLNQQLDDLRDYTGELEDEIEDLNDEY